MVLDTYNKSHKSVTDVQVYGSQSKTQSGQYTTKCKKQQNVLKHHAHTGLSVLEVSDDSLPHNKGYKLTEDFFRFSTERTQ